MVDPFPTTLSIGGLSAFQPPIVDSQTALIFRFSFILGFSAIDPGSSGLSGSGILGLARFHPFV